jgi:hypothetical protein
VLWALAFLHAALTIHDARENRRARRVMASYERD